MALLVRFIAFFAVLAMILTAFVAWSGTGDQVGGWNTFTGVLGSGPSTWYLPTPSPPTQASAGSSMTETLDYYTVLYPNQEQFFCGGVGYVHDELSRFKPLENSTWSLRPLEPTPPSGLPWAKSWRTWIDTGTDHLIVDEGVWRVTLYANIWSHYDHLFPSYPAGLNVSLLVQVMTDSYDAGCNLLNSWEAPVDYTYNFTSYSAELRNMTFEAKFPSYTYPSLLHVEVLVGFLNATWSGLPFWVGWDPNAEIVLNTGPENMFKLNMPTLRGLNIGSPQDCDFWCGISGFFRGIIDFFVMIGQWFLFIGYSIIWVNEVIFATVAWFVVVTALFFGALFGLSISGTFGPFGVVVSIVTTVFIAYVILYVVHLVRGTSGSLGI